MGKILPPVVVLALMALAVGSILQNAPGQERASRFAVPVPPRQAAELKREEDQALERAGAAVRDMQAAARTAPEQALAAKDARIVGEIRRIVLQRQTVRTSAAAGRVGAQSSPSSSSSNSSGALMSATQQMQELQMSFNLQYLMLQENMQNENQQYSMMSNIMKTKHDTAKAAIDNIK